MGWSVSNGIKFLSNDAPSEKLSLKSRGTLNAQVQENYKACITTLRLKGKIAVSSTAPATEAVSVNIKYKDDHFFNLLGGYQLKADTDVIKDVNENMAFFRFYSVFLQEGHESLQVIPTSVNIAKNANKGEADFVVDIPIPFLFYDMLNIWQTQLLTWLYKSITHTFEVRDTANVIDSVTSANEDNLASNTLSIALENVTAQTYTDYEIVDNSYLSTDEAGKPLDRAGVLQKIGGYALTQTQTSQFSSRGNNLFIKTLPTNVMQFKDLWLIVRDAITGERVDGIIDKISFKDGIRSIVEIDPMSIRNDNIRKYKISPNLFAKTNLSTPDGKGALHGVYRIDGSNFNNMLSSIRATSGWNNPMIYLDINEGISQLGKYTDPATSTVTYHGVTVEVVQNYKQVSDSLQAMANTYASSASITNIS